MALIGGISSDYLFMRKRFTSLIGVNLLVTLIEIPVLASGLYNPVGPIEAHNNLVCFILGALTDGYCYMFYMLGTIQIARKAYTCSKKCILGTTLGMVFGIGSIIQILIFDSIVAVMGGNKILFSIASVVCLSLSSAFLIPMAYEEIRYKELVCTKREDFEESAFDKGIDFDEDEVEEFEVDDQRGDCNQQSIVRESSSESEAGSHMCNNREPSFTQYNRYVPLEDDK